MRNRRTGSEPRSGPEVPAGDGQGAQPGRSGEVELDVGDAGRVPRGREVAERDRHRLPLALAEVDPARLPRRGHRGEDAAPAHEPPAPEPLDRGRRRPPREAAEAAVGEREPAGPGQPALEVNGQAVGRHDVEAAAGEQHDPGRAGLLRRGRRGPRTRRPRRSGRGSACGCAGRRQPSASTCARKGPRSGGRGSSRRARRRCGAARRARRAVARAPARPRGRTRRRRCGRPGSAGGPARPRGAPRARPCSRSRRREARARSSPSAALTSRSSPCGSRSFRSGR